MLVWGSIILGLVARLSLFELVIKCAWQNLKLGGTFG